MHHGLAFNCCKDVSLVFRRSVIKSRIYFEMIEIFYCRQISYANNQIRTMKFHGVIAFRLDQKLLIDPHGKFHAFWLNF